MIPHEPLLSIMQKKRENFEKELNRRSAEVIKEYNKNFKQTTLQANIGNIDDDYEKKPLPKKPKLSSNTPKVNLSPKKRLNLNVLPAHAVATPNFSSKKIERPKFIYGNYSRYYGYRLDTDNFHDVRLDIFCEHYKDLFNGGNKEILDIGCNSGFITNKIAKEFDIKFITGLDIDKSLINMAKNFIQKNRKQFKETKINDENNKCFPFNIDFIHGNYVLKDDVLLEIESQQFDVILCLSVTKWIHLNFGDAGLKQAFKRMFLQLRPGGKLLLEPQQWDGYKRRKTLTPEIFENYKNIKFFPKDFNNYLLGPDVGFSEMNELRVSEHMNKGFKRPIYVFKKHVNII